MARARRAPRSQRTLPLGRSVAVVGGRVVPVVGDAIDDGTVLVIDGVITAVGPSRTVRVPAGVPVLDATDRWVLPGFVEAHAHVGVDEEGIGWAGQDTNELTDPVGARFRALDAINPADEGFRDALSGGVTCVVVKPGSGNPIGGQTVAVKTWGRMVDEMVVAAPCSLKSALGENPKRVYGEKKQTPSTRLGVAAVIREALTGAQDYRDRRDAATADGRPFERDLTAEVLVEVLEGRLPWCQHAHRADDIATALRLADEFGYRLVLNHGTEGHLLADVLAAREVPVIMGPLFTSRSKVEVNLRHLRNPGLLARAGVTVALTTDHPVVPINFLVYQAILAVKEGLDPVTALQSLTINPARILDLDHRVGSLEVGKDGDLVLWDGDPLEIMSRARTVVVEGRPVSAYDDASNAWITADPYRTLASTESLTGPDESRA